MGKAPAQVTDLYLQKWAKTSFNSQARPVESLLAQSCGERRKVASRIFLTLDPNKSLNVSWL